MPNKNNAVLKTSTQEVTAPDHPPRKRFGAWFRGAGACEGPGCTNIVPAGMVSGNQRHWFCSCDCRRHAKNLRRKTYKQIVIGTCEYCDGPITATSEQNRAGARYCSNEHFRAAQYERIMQPTGPLRHELEEHIRNASHYSASTLPGVKTHLARAACYFHGELEIVDWDDVRPNSISRLIANEKKRGVKSTNMIGKLSTFFTRRIAEKDLDMPNPVLPRFHKQKSRPNEPRPLSDEAIDILWQILLEIGDVALMLAFAIALECGLRGSETANVRIPDVDTVHRTIKVRLPTKNGEERTVPYHNKVAHCLDLWMPLRNAACGHDHLLHGSRNARWNIHQMDDLYKRSFLNTPAEATNFTYHRLRHTWATRLFNAGMNLAVLQKLGGWRCLASMQVYVRVLPDKIRQEYQKAYEQLKKREQEPVDEVFSMEEFLAMDFNGDASAS